VHLGQDDLGVEEARELLGAGKIIGLSTHSLEQAERALETSADYLAVGPVFPTSTKRNPDPVVGLELVRRVRGIAARPLVAIGGITPERAPEVIAAGADSVAIISSLYPLENLRDLSARPDIAGRTREFLRALE
jgi:thiamine-phosphate pyrophosphorylase